MPDLIFHHGLDYPDNDGITLSDIAATLVAHERLLPVVASILESSVRGLTVETIRIQLDNVHTGSLSEAYFVAIFVVFQEQLEEAVPAMITDLTGVEIPETYDTLITVLFLVALLYGSKMLFERRGKTVATPPTIQGDYNTYVNIAADRLSVDAATIEAATEAAVAKRRPSVVRAAIDLFRPAKRGANGRIVPRKLPDLSKETVEAFPDQIALAELADDSEIEHFPEARLEIRATDRDKTDRGWAGKLSTEDMTTKRITVRLYPTVDREALASTGIADVEAILECKPGPDGELTPSRIHVLRLLGN